MNICICIQFFNAMHWNYLVHHDLIICGVDVFISTKFLLVWTHSLLFQYLWYACVYIVSTVVIQNTEHCFSIYYHEVVL